MGQTQYQSSGPKIKHNMIKNKIKTDYGNFKFWKLGAERDRIDQKFWISEHYYFFNISLWYTSTLDVAVINQMEMTSFIPNFLILLFYCTNYITDEHIPCYIDKLMCMISNFIIYRRNIYISITYTQPCWFWLIYCLSTRTFPPFKIAHIFHELLNVIQYLFTHKYSYNI